MFLNHNHQPNGMKLLMEDLKHFLESRNATLTLIFHGY